MFEVSEKEVKAVRRVLLSKKLFRYQPGDQSECDRFEREFAKKIGVKHAVILSSGTNALLAALLALDIGPGDEVLVPAYTFVATASAVRMAGAKPVVVNIDGTLGISTADAERKLTSKTKAIIPVHMDGLNVDLNAVLPFAKKHGLEVIEDCAQAIGGSFGKRRLGAHGKIGAFSLNENKHISCGEGGIVVTNDSEIYERLFCIQDSAARFSPSKKHIFTKKPELLGLSMRVSEIQGAIMRVQLQRLDPLLKKLRQRKRILASRLKDIGGVQVILGGDANGDCASSLHLRFDSPVAAAKMAKVLNEKKLRFDFPALRPAHVAWKWLDVIDPENARAQTADLLPSIDIVMSVLKMDVDPAMSIEQAKRLGEKIRKTLTQT